MRGRVRRLVILAIVLVGALPHAVRAQTRPSLSITLPPAEAIARTGPVVVASHMLGGRKLQELLASGFPARLHFTVELWRVGGVENDLVRLTEWDVIVRRIPVDEAYEVVQMIGDRPFSLGKFTQLADAEAAVARPTRASIVAPQNGQRFYYQATLAVQTLSFGDLDEVQRWLRGELQPAVRGKRNPGSVLGNGLKALATRLLGGERREYGARTEVFK